jgi:YfiH family protein
MERLDPDWPAPPQVKAVCTTRRGGVSEGPYADLNLGDHVGDDPSAVARNRSLLRESLGLPEEPRWLTQVHGCTVASAVEVRKGCEADAAVAIEAGYVCAVLTADCLPLLFCDRAGTRVAAVHAGWRGLVEGVVEAAVADLGVPGSELLCWLGPAIGPDAFEVGSEVRERFLKAGGVVAASAFRSRGNGKWLADIYELARQRLATLGVEAVSGGGLCTYSDPGSFFSYRRDGVTGRMASLIWLE